MLNFLAKKAWIHSRNFFVISETGFLRITDFEKTRGMAISSSASICAQILSSGGGNWIGAVVHVLIGRYLLLLQRDDCCSAPISDPHEGMRVGLAGLRARCGVVPAEILERVTYVVKTAFLAIEEHLSLYQWLLRDFGGRCSRLQ